MIMDAAKIMSSIGTDTTIGWWETLNTTPSLFKYLNTHIAPPPSVEIMIRDDKKNHTIAGELMYTTTPKLLNIRCQGEPLYPDEICPLCNAINHMMEARITLLECAGPRSNYFPGCHTPAVHPVYACSTCAQVVPVRGYESVNVLLRRLSG